MIPGQKGAQAERLIPLEEPEVDAFTARDLAEEVQLALDENSRIPLSSRCNHPLAVLQLRPQNSEPVWKRVNFIQPRDTEKVTTKVREWVQSNVVEIAPEDCVNCFSLLAVPKKDGHGKKTDIRPCLDLRPLNSRLADIPYPIPRIQKVLDAVGSATGPAAMYTTLDIRDGYFRFRIPEEDRN